MSSYGFSVTIEGPFEAAVDKVTAALKQEGFGVLTEIDVAQTIKGKLGLEMAPYKILGACNPGYAHKALTADPDIGLLLPCNVVVRQEAGGRAHVGFMDPEAVLGMVGNPQVAAIGQEGRAALERVRATLGR